MNPPFAGRSVASYVSPLGGSVLRNAAPCSKSVSGFRSTRLVKRKPMFSGRAVTKVVNAQPTSANITTSYDYRKARIRRI
jgi:hypothetical protein